MDKDLIVFNNPEFGEMRTLDENGKALFCAKDVAVALGYTNPARAINDHCKGVTKRYLLTAGGKQLTNFIPEGDIYRLAASSELPGADKFESWVFDEVLPTIRKTGTYSIDSTKQAIAEAKLLNARARVSAQWMKLCERVDDPGYRQICAHYASGVLAGKPVLPLPEAGERHLSAGEVGQMFGVTAQKI